MRGLMAAIAMLVVSTAHAERRVALVIGVSRYEHVPALKNSLNDEADMAAALRDIGFDVTEIRDPDQKAMSDGIATFSRKLPGTDVAAFYYSGHAIQVGERNFLIPRDADLELPSDVALRTLDLNAVIAGMESSARVRIILLDACRDNPFQGLAGMRSIATRGLQPIQSGVGTFVAFATAPGSTAADGDGRNSPFARALLKYIRTPGLEVNQILRNVRADVYAATAGRQVPWDHSSLIGELVLVPQSAPAEPKAASLTVPVSAAMPPAPAPASLGPAAGAPAAEPAERSASTDGRSAAIAPPSSETQPIAIDDAVRAASGNGPGGDIARSVKAAWPDVAAADMRKVLADFTRYQAADGRKAFAYAPGQGPFQSGRWPNAAMAEQMTRERCEIYFARACVLLALDGRLTPPPRNGIGTRRSMPRVLYAGGFDPRRVPAVGEDVLQRPDFIAYQRETRPKAMAIHGLGRLAIALSDEGEQAASVKALADCAALVEHSVILESPCRLYALGDRVVLPRMLGLGGAADFDASAAPAHTKARRVSVARRQKPSRQSVKF